MTPIRPLDLATARELVDFGGGSISIELAAEQLRGAVAVHNVLARRGYAYLADEVGMGKTYVTLGAVALLRFFRPSLRVLYIAPRKNIQHKWQKELECFTRTKWRESDQRVRALDGSPAARLTSCESLLAWARELVLDPHRDFVLRLPSFSFQLSEDPRQWRERWNELIALAPFLADSEPDLTSKGAFKLSLGRALYRLLPRYDLLVVDEAHHLRKGHQSQSDRNQLLAAVLGTERDRERRCERVLLLSATPLESDYAELARQLELLGFGSGVQPLLDPELDDAQKRGHARRFLVRRLTRLEVGGEEHTKNMYRLEWRGGGCHVHDEPLDVPDDRQRLVVALVQKKVAEVLSDPRFGARFQIGMLASFESFLQTAKVDGRAETIGGPDDENGDSTSSFDQLEQTEDAVEREGIDSQAVEALATSYWKEFGRALPHPKMDAVVGRLGEAFARGEKTLVFTRRVRSVPELVEKLSRAYDAWLAAELRARFANHPGLLDELEEQLAAYEEERRATHDRPVGSTVVGQGPGEDEDRGGHLTFFAWFFRGEGPPGVLSGAAFRKNRLQSESSAYGLLLEDNYVASLLGGVDGLLERLAAALGETDLDDFGERLRREAYEIARKGSRARRVQRRRACESYQVAALRALARSNAPQAEDARVVLSHVFPEFVPKARVGPTPTDFPSPREGLETVTLFTELRKRPELLQELWPQSAVDGASFATRLREREQRRALLASVIRLGHAFVDLWSAAALRLGTLELGAQEHVADRAAALITDFLDLLTRQRAAPGLHAFAELSQVGRHHELVVAANFAKLDREPIRDLPSYFKRALANQEPVAGMFGQVTTRLVAQFRMPGYPLVLCTTDVLQEGEDLHTFCSRVVHYGISWTPSAMEQRTGRVDRIGSLGHRRLACVAGRRADPDELLQVQYPHLRDSVELLQVQRVFERMNAFLRKLHVTTTGHEWDSRLNAAHEFARAQRDIAPVRELLRSPFEVDPSDLEGDRPAVQGPRRETHDLVQHAVALLREIERLVHLEVTSRELEEGRLIAEVFVDSARRELLERGAAGRADAAEVVGQRVILELLPSGLGEGTLLRARSLVGQLDATPYALIKAQRSLPGVRLCQPEAGAPVEVRADLPFEPALTQLDEVLDLLTRVAWSGDRLEREFLPEDARSGRVTSDRLKAIGGDDARAAWTGLDLGEPAEAPSHPLELLSSAGATPPERFAFEVDPRARATVMVRLPGGRTQRVRCKTEGRYAVFDSTVARRHTLDGSRKDLCIELLQRNTFGEVIGLGLTADDLVQAWVHHPLASLQPRELSLLLRHLAEEADRLELLLTGEDVH